MIKLAVRQGHTLQMVIAHNLRLQEQAFAAWSSRCESAQQAEIAADRFAASRLARFKPALAFFKAWAQEMQYSNTKRACMLAADNHAGQKLSQRAFAALKEQQDETRCTL